MLSLKTGGGFRKRHPQIWTTTGSNSLFSRTNSLFLRESLQASEFARVSAFKNQTKQDFDRGLDQTRSDESHRDRHVDLTNALTRPGAMKAIEIAC
ncbi:MAG TPA: hypothetical protein VFJ59_05655 [Pseudolabrys sp.]|nr:hypothetical protein [Pseudolabrys sp.]